MSKIICTEVMLKDCNINTVDIACPAKSSDSLTVSWHPSGCNELLRKKLIYEPTLEFKTIY